MFPPEAVQWARQEGLPAPPESYDIIAETTLRSPDVNIQAPAMFAFVRGSVKIMGSATGADFSYYRLQVGQGLNPGKWLQIGEDIDQPVTSGQLGTWNTQGLSGLYALQLLLVRNNQRIETHTIQVAIDNQAPFIRSVSPSSDLELTASTNTILLRADVWDDLSIKSVSFYLDGDLVAAPSLPPYTAAWQASRGRHTLKVLVTDQAGNSAETIQIFTVQ